MSVQAMDDLTTAIKNNITDFIIEHLDEEVCQKINQVLQKVTYNNITNSKKIRQLETIKEASMQKVKDLEEKRINLEEKLEEIQEEKLVVVATSTKNIQALKQNTEEKVQ